VQSLILDGAPTEGALLAMGARGATASGPSLQEARNYLDALPGFSAYGRKPLPGTARPTLAATSQLSLAIMRRLRRKISPPIGD